MPPPLLTTNQKRNTTHNNFDRCFDEGLFEAARLLFAHIPNWGRLASTLVRLHRYACTDVLVCKLRWLRSEVLQHIRSSACVVLLM